MIPDPSIFISYAHADQPVAEKLAHALQERGIEPYLLGEQSSIHTDLAIEVRSAIRSSYAILLLLSSSSVESKAVQEDLEFARQQGDKPIFYVSIDGTEASEALGRTLHTGPATQGLEQVAETLYQLRPLKWSEPAQPVVHFGSEVTPEQAKGVLEAFANYWRGCGGIGFSVEFEYEEERITETTSA
jgi:hypothetical protein